MAPRIPKIVVIDDSEIVLAVTKGALVSAGYHVVVYDRTAGSVGLILQEKPDLVLMDVNMPGLAGDTALNVLGRAQPHAETIVLLHSSLPVEVLRTKAAAAGAHGFIQKGGDMFALVRQVNQWLKRLASSGHMRVAAPAAVDDRDRAAPFDLKSVLLVDDDMGVLSVYRRLLQKVDVDIEFALSGGQAVRRMLSDTAPDVVVCDMVLPDLSGIEVFRQVTAVAPSYRKRFVFATGASTQPTISAFLSGFAGPVLRKPVVGSQLVEAIRACLPGASQTASSARG